MFDVDANFSQKENVKASNSDVGFVLSDVSAVMSKETQRLVLNQKVLLQKVSNLEKNLADLHSSQLKVLFLMVVALVMIVFMFFFSSSNQLKNEL